MGIAAYANNYTKNVGQSWRDLLKTLTNTSPLTLATGGSTNDAVARFVGGGVIDTGAALARTVNRILPEVIGGTGSRAAVEKNINSWRDYLVNKLPTDPAANAMLGAASTVLQPVGDVVHTAISNVSSNANTQAAISDAASSVLALAGIASGKPGVPQAPKAAPRVAPNDWRGYLQDPNKSVAPRNPTFSNLTTQPSPNEIDLSLGPKPGTGPGIPQPRLEGVAGDIQGELEKRGLGTGQAKLLADAQQNARVTANFPSRGDIGEMEPDSQAVHQELFGAGNNKLSPVTLQDVRALARTRENSWDEPVPSDKALSDALQEMKDRGYQFDFSNEIRHTVSDNGEHEVGLYSNPEYGSVTANENNGYLQVQGAYVNPSFRGYGLGTSLYQPLKDYAERSGLKFSSDFSVSPDAQKVWKNFENEGESIQTNPHMVTKNGTLMSLDQSSPVYEMAPRGTNTNGVQTAKEGVNSGVYGFDTGPEDNWFTQAAEAASADSK